MARFVFAYANSPVAGMGLNLSSNQKSIEAVFEKLDSGLKTIIHNVSLNNVRDQLTENIKVPAEVFQFSGHGTEEHLHFFDETGDERRLISYQEFAQFLGGVNGLKLVIFDCCHSKKIAKACVDAGVPAAIGTVSALADITSHILNANFWKNIAQGMSIKDSLTQANSLYKADSHFNNSSSLWELFVNPNIPDSGGYKWILDKNKTKISSDSHNSIHIEQSKNFIGGNKINMNDSTISFGN